MYSRQATIGGRDAKDHLAAAAAVLLLLLVPPSAVSHPPPPDASLEETTEINSAKVCGASECREVSDPEAATALAVVRTRRLRAADVRSTSPGTDAPSRGLPW